MSKNKISSSSAPNVSGGGTLFRTKAGVIAATLGSAVGLGSIWRFPAEAQANGGGAFLLLYMACVLVLGIPVMLAETSLGAPGVRMP